jgi:hypothetical protein
MSLSPPPLLNLIIYAGNNAYKNIDPLGLQLQFIIGGGIFLAYELTPSPANAPSSCDVTIPEDPYAPLENAAIAGTTLDSGSLLGSAVTTDSAIFGKGSYLFGRGGGLFNSNDYFRIGWNWSGSAQTGSDVFRIAIGNKNALIHWHINLW